MRPSRGFLLIPAVVVAAAIVCLSPSDGAERPKAPPPGPNPSPPPAKAADNELPYVYTHWKQFTTADGLPNDHIFAVKADGPRVWVGTEDGLACYDKRTGKFRSWKEKDGLPWRVVTAIDVDPKTGDVWLGLFGGGLARYSGGRFDSFNQLNSGLVNDVVYGVCVEHDNIWAATTAGASRYNVKTGQWTIFTEKNSPMEEIWNYSVCYDQGKVYLGVWGSGCLEYDVAVGKSGHGDPWKAYEDPDGEMEIDLYRDDGIIHVIVTGVSHAEDALWIGTYFGTCRYDGRHWRGFYAQETGLPSDFANGVKARSSNECYYAFDKGLGAVADFRTDTYVAYTRNADNPRGKAKIYRSGRLLKEVELASSLPHNFLIAVETDGHDLWVGSAKGLAWARGDGYYSGVKANPEWLQSVVTSVGPPSLADVSTPRGGPAQRVAHPKAAPRASSACVQSTHPTK